MYGWKKCLIPVCLAACLLAGCGSLREEETQPSKIVDSMESTTEPDFGDVVIGGDTSGDPVEVQGKERITYERNESAVRYVTSADQLPDWEALETYDDAYFETHALILVTQSVSSGSVDVSIKAIQKTETGYGVVLSYGDSRKDQVGTNDMATWLLWAETEQGQDGTWEIVNPALTPEGEKI